MAGEKEKVCVTGAGGFAASRVVNLLLSQDYLVHGIVRQPGGSKYDQLNKLEKASENLKLFKADLLDYESLYSAFLGCSGVFHVASLVPITTATNPIAEILELAVKARTLNVLIESLLIGQGKASCRCFFYSRCCEEPNLAQ